MLPQKRAKITRYIKISRRKIERLTWERIGKWFKANLKDHPIILGILFFIWMNEILTTNIFARGSLRYLIIFHGLILIIWLALVVISNLLRDKAGVKWYFKKRFVLLILLLLPPLGIILTWLGANFKKAAKITLTLIFGLFFISATLYYNHEYKKFLNQPSIERIIEIITHNKKETFLKVGEEKELKNLQLVTLHKPTAKLAISEIANKCLPTIVSITTKDKQGEKIGEGSGFIISSNGFIMTNFHVLESAYTVEIRIGDAKYEDAYLAKASPDRDIAILKINADNLTVLPIGNSDAIISGQPVVVLGNPGGFERSVTNGIVSAVRTKGDRKFIQISAPVSPGSSGGPVINEYGEAVGIATLASFFFTQNLNFAIPINDLKKLIRIK